MHHVSALRPNLLEHCTYNAAFVSRLRISIFFHLIEDDR